LAYTVIRCAALACSLVFPVALPSLLSASFGHSNSSYGAEFRRYRRQIMKPALPPESANGFEAASAILRHTHPDLIVSKRKLRKADAIELVRGRRESAQQSLGFASRPFVLCGLPIKKPKQGELLHERRNGKFLLQVTGHPSYGLPWGQDRLVPIFLATLAVRQQCQTIRFRSAAEMLDTFGMQQGGTQYRRLFAAFQRIFGATIFFGTDMQRDKAAVIHQARFNFMTEARIWYARDHEQQTLPGGCQNEIILSPEFYREIMAHPIPADLDAAKALSSSPAALDLFMWISYRCFTARGEERVPLFGDFGLVNQLGSSEYARPRRFRERLGRWLDLVKSLWPDCPVRVSSEGGALIVNRAQAIHSGSDVQLGKTAEY
jgi:Plasmid encoded RepA protein